MLVGCSLSPISALQPSLWWKYRGGRDFLSLLQEQQRRNRGESSLSQIVSLRMTAHHLVMVLKVSYRDTQCSSEGEEGEEENESVSSSGSAEEQELLLVLLDKLGSADESEETLPLPVSLSPCRDRRQQRDTQHAHTSHTAGESASSLTVEEWLDTSGLFVLRLDSLEDDVVFAHTFLSPLSASPYHSLSLSMSMSTSVSAEHTRREGDTRFLCVITASGMAFFWRFDSDSSAWRLFCDHDFALYDRYTLNNKDKLVTNHAATSLSSSTHAAVESALPSPVHRLRQVWLDDTLRCVLRLEDVREYSFEHVEDKEREGCVRETVSVRVSVHDYSLWTERDRDRDAEEVRLAISPSVSLFSLSAVSATHYAEGVLCVVGQRGDRDSLQHSHTPSVAVHGEERENESMMIMYDVHSAVCRTLSLCALLEECCARDVCCEDLLGKLRKSPNACQSLNIEFLPRCEPLSRDTTHAAHTGPATAAERISRIFLLVEDVLCVLRVLCAGDGENSAPCGSGLSVCVERAVPVPRAVRRCLRHSEQHVVDAVVLAETQDEIFLAYTLDNDELLLQRVRLAHSLQSSNKNRCSHSRVEDREDFAVDDEEDLFSLSLRLLPRPHTHSHSSTHFRAHLTHISEDQVEEHRERRLPAARPHLQQRVFRFLCVAHCELHTRSSSHSASAQDDALYILPLLYACSGIYELRARIKMGETHEAHRHVTVAEMLRSVFPSTKVPQAEALTPLPHSISPFISPPLSPSASSPSLSEVQRGHYLSVDQFLKELMQRHVLSSSFSTYTHSQSLSLSLPKECAPLPSNHWMRTLDLFSLRPCEASSSLCVDWALLGKVIDPETVRALLPFLLRSRVERETQHRQDRDILECVWRENERKGEEAKEREDENATMHEQIVERESLKHDKLRENGHNQQSQTEECEEKERQNTEEADEAEEEEEEEPDWMRHRGSESESEEEIEHDNELPDMHKSQHKYWHEHGHGYGHGHKYEDKKREETLKSNVQEEQEEETEDEEEGEDSFLRDVHSEAGDDNEDAEFCLPLSFSLDIALTADAAHLSTCSPLPFLVRALCLSHTTEAVPVVHALLEIARSHRERARRAHLQAWTQSQTYSHAQRSQRRRRRDSLLRWSSLSADIKLHSVTSQPDRHANAQTMKSPLHGWTDGMTDTQIVREREAKRELWWLASRECVPWRESERVSSAVLRVLEREREHFPTNDENERALEEEDWEDDAMYFHDENEDEDESESELAHCAVQCVRGVWNALVHSSAQRPAHCRLPVLCERELCALGLSLPAQDTLLSLQLLAQTQASGLSHTQAEAQTAIPELALTLCFLRRSESLVMLAVRVAASLAFVERESERWSAVMDWREREPKKLRVSLSSLVDKDYERKQRSAQKKTALEREREMLLLFSRRVFFFASASDNNFNNNAGSEASPASLWLCRYYALGSDAHVSLLERDVRVGRGASSLQRDLSAALFAEDEESVGDLPRALGVSLAHWSALRALCNQRRAEAATVFFIALEHLLSAKGEGEREKNDEEEQIRLLSELIFFKPFSIDLEDIELFLRKTQVSEEKIRKIISFA